MLAGGAGGDDLSGDEGWDTADYTGRPEALTIDLDDQRDDGAAGEGDNVRTTVETVIGGAGGRQDHRQRRRRTTSTARAATTGSTAAPAATGCTAAPARTP